MQKALMVVMAVLIVAGIAFVIHKRKELQKPVETKLISDDVHIADFMATVALPLLLKDAAKACDVKNPDGALGLDLSLAVETLEHGVKVKGAEISADAGRPPFAECVLGKLRGNALQDPAFTLPADHEYAFDLYLPLPRTQAN